MGVRDGLRLAVASKRISLVPFLVPAIKLPHQELCSPVSACETSCSGFGLTAGLGSQNKYSGRQE